MQPGWIQDAEIGRAPGLQGRQRKGVIGMSEQDSGRTRGCGYKGHSEMEILEVAPPMRQ